MKYHKKALKLISYSFIIDKFDGIYKILYYLFI